ncbi:hypothetical protein QDK53_34330 [Amycolatopsis magusensis]|nr:hypothetical protein [Amycolatopsis magusensis]MDI5981322.1 hypothetical protein [Amycolatopsis magusensis]
MVSELRIERVVTTGVFALDGGTWDVDNNVWLVGDDDEVVIIDAAHDDAAIIGSIRDRVLKLPEETRVHTGHGDGTTVGTEAPHLSDWIARGY